MRLEPLPHDTSTLDWSICLLVVLSGLRVTPHRVAHIGATRHKWLQVDVFFTSSKALLRASRYKLLTWACSVVSSRRA